MMKMRTKRLSAVLVSAGLVLAACGDSDSATETTSTTTDIPTTTMVPESSSTTVAGNTEARSAPQTSDETTRLTGVRLTRQNTAGDRVTFEFDDAVPGYDIGYATMPPRQDGSGDPVPVAGNAGIAVRLTGASGVELTGGVNRTYTGPDRLGPTDTANIAEVVRVSDFEGQLVWAIGLDQMRSFEVSTLTAPSRVVIDIR